MNYTLYRKIGEPLKLTAPGGHEIMLTPKSIDNGVIQFSIGAPQEVKAEHADSWDELPTEDKAQLRRFFK